MMLLPSWLAVLILYSIFCMDFINGYEETINMDRSCTTGVIELNEDKIYRLEWTGGDPGYCKITFIGRDTDYLNEYTVCVEPEQFYFQALEIFLNYYEGFDSYPSKTYVKDDYPDKFCAEQDKYLAVQLKIGSSVFSPWFDTSSSYFTLKVTATKTYDYDATVGAIVGGVLGGLALLGIAVTVCIVIACRRKRYAGQVNHPTTVPMVNQEGNQSSAYPQQTVGYGQPVCYPHQQIANPPLTGYIQPCAYPVQGYVYPCQQYQQIPQHAPDTAAPPPSYGEATKPS